MTTRSTAARAIEPRRSRGRPALELDEDAVLDAAVATLAAGDAVMLEIAERCGVAKTTINDRFGGKAGLVDRAIQRERRRLADHLVAAYVEHRAATASEQVTRGFEAFFDYARTRPDSFSVLFGPAVAPAGEARADVVDTIAELISSRFSAAGAELAMGSRIIATLIVGVGEAAARLVTSDGLDPEVMARFAAGLVVNGLDHLDVGLLFEVNAAAPRAATARRSTR